MAKGDTPSGREVISAAKLKKLLAADKGARHDIDEIVGTIRERRGRAVEKDHLNKGVYGIIQRLERLPTETLAIWLEDLDHMLDASGLRDRAAEAPTLMGGADLSENEADEAEQDKAARRAKSKDKPGTVVSGKFPLPRGEAAE